MLSFIPPIHKPNIDADIADHIAFFKDQIPRVRDSRKVRIIFGEFQANPVAGRLVGQLHRLFQCFPLCLTALQIRKYRPVSCNHMGDSIPPEAKWDREVSYTPVMRLDKNPLHAMEMLEQMGRIEEKLRGLDCGSCGAPSCHALAEDIVRGEASERDCVYYLRDNLHKLSQEVAVLAEDLAERESENGDKGRLNALKEYIQMISDEMAVLDSKVKDENVKAEDE